MSKIKLRCLLLALVMVLCFAVLSYIKEKIEDVNKIAILAAVIAAMAAIVGLLPAVADLLSEANSSKSNSELSSIAATATLDTTTEPRPASTPRPTSTPISTSLPEATSTQQSDRNSLASGVADTKSAGLPVIQDNYFSGELTMENQDDVYRYIAPVSGKYRFDLDSSDVRTTYRFCVYAANNTRICNIAISEQSENCK